MTAPGKYLYCVIRCAEERTLDGAVAIGDPGATVYTTVSNGLAAVVSSSPATEYESTRSNMLAHQRVLEQVLKDWTLLPVRFGTVANGASPDRDIRRLLEKRKIEFEDLLRDMEGRVELGVKALWKDEALVFQELLAENPPIRRLRDSLAAKPLQASHFDRIRLGETIKRALERKRVSEAARINGPLRRIACRATENPVVLDRMILNASFLVDKEREGEFDSAVAQMDGEQGGRVTFKYVGPVPPYNFVSIVVNWRDL